MRYLLSCVLLFFCSNLSYALNHIRLDVYPNQKEFSFALPANPSTGYSWTITGYDHDVLNLKSAQYLPTSRLAGSGGQMIYTFERVPNTNLPTLTIIHLDYSRPWDQTTVTPQVVTVHFVLAH